jgi:hypothetical protein
MVTASCLSHVHTVAMSLRLSLRYCVFPKCAHNDLVKSPSAIPTRAVMSCVGNLTLRIVLCKYL